MREITRLMCLHLFAPYVSNQGDPYYNTFLKRRFLSLDPSHPKSQFIKKNTIFHKFKDGWRPKWKIRIQDSYMTRQQLWELLEPHHGKDSTLFPPTNNLKSKTSLKGFKSIHSFCVFMCEVWSLILKYIHHC